MTEKRIIPSSELIINDDGSIFHLHLKPGQLSDKIILCGDPARVDMIGKYLENIEVNITNREFHSITGTYKGKRLSIVSHGIGTDNIDIVLNELDALVNIDFETRQEKNKFTQLTMVRVGTSGGLQEFVPVGTYVAAQYSIGFDGVMYFYNNTEKIRNKEFEEALIKGLDWKIEGLKPYVVPSNPELIEQICQDDIVRGVTIAANGFYGPQGRSLRLALKDPDLNQKIGSFKFGNYQITNFEMESSSLAGLSALLGHKAMTVCCIIAGRVKLNMNTNYKDSIRGLIETVLDRI